MTPLWVAEDAGPDTRRERLPRRSRWGRGARFVGNLALAFVLGAVGAGGALLLRSLRGEEPGSPGAGGPVPEQAVVAWTVWQPAGPAFVTVLASGGGRDPLALGIPAHAVVSVPGHGLGTVGDAAQGGDALLVATTVENVLQVHVDTTVATPLADMGRLVDGLGGIPLGGVRTVGEGVVRYLSGGEGAGEFRFLRWQEVLAATLPELAGRQEALGGVVPDEVHEVFAALASKETDVLELPVQDVGAGLARPVPEEVAALVQERFVAGRGGGQARLVILNGNGIPGIGEEIARLLVPAGFRLVSSQNAPAFDVPFTRIVASGEEFLDEAELARELLGVGEVNLGEQPTGVADVSVLVGRDFGGA